MKMGAGGIVVTMLVPALLSGCVAALIPVAAGGLIVGKDKLRTAPASRQAGDGMGEPAIAAADAPPAQQPVVLKGAEQLAFNRPGTRSHSAGAALAPDLRTPMAGDQAFAGFSEYVEAQAGRNPILQPRQSALLAVSGSLTPDRSDCSIRPPAVIIDLDPSSAMFNPAVEGKPATALAQMLRSFRMRDTEVFWISGLPALDSAAVRQRLIASGLDPSGRDGLLLMRRADERKQARRRELAATHCVIAIAGDAKSDFDELFDYLKDPSTSWPLDELLDAGWFLTPLPLLDISTTEGQ